MASRILNVENAPHVVGSGSNRILLVLPDVYSKIGTNIGVVKLAGDPPAGVPSTTVGRAIADGLVRKIKITFLNSKGKRAVATVIVAGEKAAQARATLIGSTYRDSKILTAYYPTRIQLG